MSNAEELGAALISEAQFRIAGESLPRIHKCLNELSDEDIWHRPNDAVVSVGNLVLHLCGNVRQWIISTLGGEPDRRDRDSEFDSRTPIPREELLRRLDETVQAAGAVLDRVDPSALLERRRVQGREETILSIIVHVTEHFSYHTGQITLHVKLRKAVNLGYYAGRDLNAR